MEPTELQGSGSNGPLLWGMDTYIVTQSTDTLIPPNSRILRVGIFGNVSLEPKVFSTKSGFQTHYLLNNKNSELENFASLEPRVREGLVYKQHGIGRRYFSDLGFDL